MKRRNFLQISAYTGVGLWLPVGGMLTSFSGKPGHSLEFKNLISELLKEWCDGMIKNQIIKSSDSRVHGLIKCPACEHVHARIIDAVHPFFYMAKISGDKKYLDAGIAAFEWGKNVSRDDGAWTNDLDAKSWDGTTVFAAISLAETLQYHGNLIDSDRHSKWLKRLELAADFVYDRFNEIGNANINYGATSIYALNLFGKLLNEPKYLLRSKELAKQIKSFFTNTNSFLFGEAQGNRKRLSAKGLHGIDLGYNLEESLNYLTMYALDENDEEILELVNRSLHTHVEFIIPDGGLDNSFGNRMYKWSYWGSRTSDGMQLAFGMMANRNPAFGTAAFLNTELLKKCTHNGLLHGGLHYMSHDIKPCIHHTFTHAKSLAAVLEHWDYLPKVNKTAPLPRAIADGVKYFKDIDTTLFARGAWRGTVSAYDAEYDLSNDCRQGSGGALSLLYHNKIGLLCTASMAVYKLQEANNQQPQPGKDIALTPRIETYKEDVWYTNLYDLPATVTSKDENGTIELLANVNLKNVDREKVKDTASAFNISYNFSANTMEIHVKTNQPIINPTAFVLPIVSSSNEEVNRLNAYEMSVKKPEGMLHIKSNLPIKMKEIPGSRTFNMVPGVEALPIEIFFEDETKKINISIEIA
tara:strand:- start:17049 stop:18965 length:1917 start_codon:yes stop_codon:yes gene_type:complete